MQSPDTTQIVAAYEAGMPIPEIAECFSGGQIENIKFVLLQFSSTYREHINGSGKGTKDDFSDDEQQRAVRKLVTIMDNTDDEYLGANIAKYIRNDKKGRLDKTDISKIHVNIGQLNAVFTKADTILKSIHANSILINIPTKEREMLEAANV